MSWYMKGQSDYDSANFHMGFYFDIGGFPSGDYASQAMPGDVNDGDPFLTVAASTQPWNPGSQELELGLWNDYRIKVSSSGIHGWHQASGEWFDLFAGQEEGTQPHPFDSASGIHTGELPLTDLESYSQGRIIIGGVSDWSYLELGTGGYFLKAGASYPEWAQLSEADISDLNHNDTYAIHDNIDNEFGSISEKGTPASGDLLLIEDSASSYSKKYVQVSNLPSGTPSQHNSTHEDGGSDEINVGGLSGQLADAQTPISHNNTYHSTNYEPEFSKNTAFNKNFGTGSTEVCVGNDARLSDSRTPTAHSSSHETGGSDEIYFSQLEHTSGDPTLHDSLTSTPHVSSSEKTTWSGKADNPHGNSQHSSTFITALSEDSTPQLGGALDTNGQEINDDSGDGIVVIDDDLNVSGGWIKNQLDNEGIYTGIGDDLRLYHSGVASYVLNTTGNLYIDEKTPASSLILRTGSTPTAAITITSAQIAMFQEFPITPSAEPDADYEVANKKYVDDHSGGGGGGLGDLDDVTITGPADLDLLQFDNGSGDWVDRSLAEIGLAELDQLQIGSGNKSYCQLVFDGNYDSDSFRKGTIPTWYNYSAGTKQLHFKCPLPLQLADGKHLHVDYMYISQYDADANDYISGIYVYGWSSYSSYSTLYSNTTNRTSASEIGVSTGTDDWGDYKGIDIRLEINSTTATEWELGYIYARYWYE